MTEAQRLRTLGFNASLNKRGVLLKLLPAGPAFQALVEEVQPEAAEFTVSEETRDEAFVAVLREHLGNSEVNVGDTLKNEAASIHYRVTRVLQRPSDIAVRFRCEVA